MSNSDYYSPGTWNIACSMCGQKLKADQVEKNWMGMYRCFRCNESRHPQDFVTATEDKQTAPFVQRQTDFDIQVCTFDGLSAIAGYAIAGCAVAGRNFYSGGIVPIPEPPEPPTTLIWTADSTLITADSTEHTADEG